MAMSISRERGIFSQRNIFKAYTVLQLKTDELKMHDVYCHKISKNSPVANDRKIIEVKFLELSLFSVFAHLARLGSFKNDNSADMLKNY